MDDFKKIIFPLLGAVAFIVFVGFLYGKKESKSTVDVKIGNTVIKAILANNEKLRKKGLGGTEQLNENEGMLFVFDEKGGTGRYPPVFWMKDMLIAIDIIWIDDGKIIQIDKDVKPPQKDTPDNDLVKYTSKNPVDYVLEVNGGYSESKVIKEGDGVETSL